MGAGLVPQAWRRWQVLYIPVHTNTYGYILICTSMYWYIVVCTSMYHELAKVLRDQGKFTKTRAFGIYLAWKRNHMVTYTSIYKHEIHVYTRMNQFVLNQLFSSRWSGFQMSLQHCDTAKLMLLQVSFFAGRSLSEFVSASPHCLVTAIVSSAPVK